MVRRTATRNTTKIEELKSELKLSDIDFRNVVQEVGIRLEEGQKNLDQNEVGKIRRHLNEQQRRRDLKTQTIDLPPIVTVQNFAEALELPVGEILQVLLKNGVTATLNDSIDYETAAIIAEDLGYKTSENVEKLEETVLTPEALEEILKKEDPKQQQPRPPVVTIMGHVDHGKTTLLDTIRQANVAGEEAGGITQAISSYQVQHKDQQITFIDTPGHETFEFMRQRGASLADVAILVVAADDGVKPQTKEAIKHARAAKVPIIVAINKVDKPTANIEKVKKELADNDLAPEDWGGKTVMVPVSALKGEGIDDLLEMIILTAAIEKPLAILDRPALGSVVESNLDKHLGPIATVLIHTGTLKVKDDIVIGHSAGHVRRLIDFKGKSINVATPAMPVTIVGLTEVPEAGEIMQVVEEKSEARHKASQQRAPIKSLVTSADEDDERQTLAMIIKADSNGSIEAIRETVSTMVPEEVRLSIIRSDVGNVSHSDVLTAKAADAIVYAFNTHVEGLAKKLADKEHVAVKSYKVVYELTDDVRAEIEQRLPVDIIRTDLGTVKVLKIFFSTQKRKIAGGEVTDGSIEKDANAIIWRKTGKQREEIGQGLITDIQIEKKAVKKARKGDQVGLTYEGKGKMKAGDILELYREEKLRRELATPKN